MELRLLGPIELWFGDRRVSAGPAKQRCVLAVLGLSAGIEVPTTALIDRVWGEVPPAGVRNVLYTHIARLKRLMSETMPPGLEVPLRRGLVGYVLDIERHSVDAHTFEAAVASALRAETDRQRLTTLRAALDLWRGTPLPGIAGAWADSTRAALERTRISAFLELADVELRANAIGPDLLEELRRLLADNPFEEHLCHKIMQVLCRSGRPAEALKLYDELQRQLSQELGQDPSPELQRLHRRILQQDPALDAAPPEVSVRAQTPRQLPIAPATFVGRTAELTTATRTLTNDERYAPPIIAIHGSGGVGKSALALRAAHASAHVYPDGQLYIDLQGSSPGVKPVPPLEALSRFLRALGIAAAEVPADEAEAAARFRSLLAERRVLLVLDNAVDATQIRPLLPANRKSGVLVTSRSMLSALGDVTHLDLEVLRPDESVDLLTRLDPTGRLAAEDSYARQLADLCGHLPLALRIAAARMNSRPQWPLGALIENLSDEQHRLDRLGHDDLSIRACFQASYQVLADGDAVDQAAARAFRLLGLPDGPDISLPIAARLLDVAEPEAEAALDRLMDVRLLDSPMPGRYRMHDLLRLYAREVAAREIDVTGRPAALARMWRCYVASAASAGQIIRPGFRENLIDAKREDALSFVDRHDAMDWLERECENLLSAARQAADAPSDLRTITVHIAHALFDFMHGSARWKDLRELNQVALRVSRTVGDLRAEGQVLNDLGVMAWRSGDGGGAVKFFRQSVRILRERGDARLHANALQNLGNAHSERGEYQAALSHLEEALSLRRTFGYRAGEARTLNVLATTNRHLGHLDLSRQQLQAALSIASSSGHALDEALIRRNLGDVLVEQNELDEAIQCYRRSADSALPALRAWILADLGEAYRRVGDLRQASEVCEEALELSGRVGAQQEHGRALWRLGCVLADIGESERARDCWRKALPIFERLGTMETAEVARLLGYGEPALSEAGKG